MMSLSANVTNILRAPKPISPSSGVSSLRKHLRYFDPSGAPGSTGFAAAARLSFDGMNAAENIPARAIPAAPAVISFTNPLRVVPFSVFRSELISASPLNKWLIILCRGRRKIRRSGKRHVHSCQGVLEGPGVTIEHHNLVKPRDVLKEPAGIPDFYCLRVRADVVHGTASGRGPVGVHFLAFNPSRPQREAFQVLAESADKDLPARRKFDFRHGPSPGPVVGVKPVPYLRGVRAVQLQRGDAVTHDNL